MKRKTRNMVLGLLIAFGPAVLAYLALFAGLLWITITDFGWLKGLTIIGVALGVVGLVVAMAAIGSLFMLKS